MDDVRIRRYIAVQTDSLEKVAPGVREVGPRSVSGAVPLARPYSRTGDRTGHHNLFRIGRAK